MKTHALLLAATLVLLLPGAVAAAPADIEPLTLTIFAAGSLRDVLPAVEQQYDASGTTRFTMVYASAGLLARRIENGERPDLFLSANLAYPQQLAREGKAQPARVFTRNTLCVTGRPGLGLTQDNVLARLLDPALKLATSTPVVDPGGDYTWEMFHRADAVQPGAYALLNAKARQLFSGPQRVEVPPGQDHVRYLLAQHEADLFVGYCSGPARELERVELPANLQVVAQFGFAVLNGTPRPQAAAARFAQFLLTPAAQATFSAHGFQPVDAPAQNAPRDRPAGI